VRDLLAFEFLPIAERHRIGHREHGFEMRVGAGETDHSPGHLVGDSPGTVVTSQTTLRNLSPDHDCASASAEILPDRYWIHERQDEILQPARIVIAFVLFLYAVAVYYFRLAELG
jgi:hypothetical protein